MNKKIIRDALILTAFTLILGLVLGFVNDITHERIEEQDKQKQMEAFREVFEDATDFVEYDYNKEDADKLVSDGGYSDSIDDIRQAMDESGETLGYVISVTAKDGSQGSISFSVGIRMDGTVNGYKITKIAETPGLGMKAEEEDFYSQFQNKQVEAFEVVKQEPASDNQIEAITGSTITSKAMANGCNAAILYFQKELQGVAES